VFITHLCVLTSVLQSKTSVQPTIRRFQVNPGFQMQNTVTHECIISFSYKIVSVLKSCGNNVLPITINHFNNIFLDCKMFLYL